jgi:hypothetical protein
MCDALMGDRHFNNCKYYRILMRPIVLGEFLSKRPSAKKVEIFMAKQLQLKIDQMTLEMKIQSKYPFYLMSFLKIPFLKSKLDYRLDWTALKITA